MSKFAHLHVHSHYSLLDGLSKIDELVAYAKELGLSALALTDHGNLYGALEFHKKAKAAGLKAIIGCEVYVAVGSRHSKINKVDNVRYHLVLLAKNNEGYRNLCELVTKSNLEGFYYKPRVDRELLREHAKGLICLSACLGGEVARALAAGDEGGVKKIALTYKEIYGSDYYLEIQPHNGALNDKITALGKKLDIPLVATQDSHYLRPEDAPIHEVLLAIQTNNRLDNDDRFSFKEINASLRSPEEMEKIFDAWPEAIANTVKIAAACDFNFDFAKPELPDMGLPKGETPFSYLEKLVTEKLPRRFVHPSQTIRERLTYELEVIKKTGFADYFLIVQDLVNWAKDHGIVVGPGRGSAAGSMVSYILGITDIDPVKYNLLFERFLNPERNEMPDIDIDFTDERRDEVLAYLKNKYGGDKVARIITFGTMAARAAVRDAGRALGLPYAFCDKLAKAIPFQPNLDSSARHLSGYVENIPELKNMYDNDKDAKKVLDAAMKLEGVVRHASVHACGTVIAKEPLTHYFPLQRSPQDENTIITQFEGHGVEALGLLKMDLLGLKNLTIIEKTIRLVKELRSETVDLNKIPLDDEKTFVGLQKGDATGVFQLESQGMRHYLKELKPTNIEDIIAMIALYRPGPMELIPSFIKRKFGKEEVSYLHPRLEPILKNTYGIGVYQEQMMQIARDLAGFTLPEADTLRKAIGKKIKKLLDEQKEKLLNGMKKNGLDLKTATAIWELFPPFARYGFNRSHAAAYAMISYQTAYLKAHYPTEFVTSLLNIADGDVERINFLVEEAKRTGIKVLPPDINLSSQYFAPDESGENQIRFGLLAVKNIGINIVNFIIEERGERGPYADMRNFLERVKHKDLNKKSLEALIKAGALDSLGIERGQALENIEEFLKYSQTIKKNAGSNQFNLFGSEENSNGGLRLRSAPPADKAKILAWERELLGLYVTDHPWNAYSEKIKDKVKSIQEVLAMAQGDQRLPLVVTAGIITSVKKMMTKTSQPMLFVSLADNTAEMEVVVFANVLSKSADLWQEGRPVMVKGRLSPRNDRLSFIAEAIKEIKE